MHQNAPNGASIALYVPAAQQQRIVQLRQMGKSVREIARREKRHRRTINKVLWYNADQMREYNEQSQAGETKLPASWLCPHCGGAMVLIEKFTAQEIRSRLAEESHFVDSS
jgi:rubredoxin